MATSASGVKLQRGDAVVITGIVDCVLDELQNGLVGVRLADGSFPLFRPHLLQHVAQEPSFRLEEQPGPELCLAVVYTRTGAVVDRLTGEEAVRIGRMHEVLLRDGAAKADAFLAGVLERALPAEQGMVS